MEGRRMGSGPGIESYRFGRSGSVPNSDLPVLVHRGAVDPGSADLALGLELLFAEHGWANSWRNGVYPFHHFHSTSHEVLGIAGGQGCLRIGGETGLDVAVFKGDVVVLPAGTGHQRRSASDDFVVVGAYPDGRDWDLIRADEGSEDAVRRATMRIAAVPLPDFDPVLGEGGLRLVWARPT